MRNRGAREDAILDHTQHTHTWCADFTERKGGDGGGEVHQKVNKQEDEGGRFGNVTQMWGARRPSTVDRSLF